MPHNYTLVVKAKDCLFHFEFDFCDFCWVTFGVLDIHVVAEKFPSKNDIMNYWPVWPVGHHNYGGNSDGNEAEFTNKLHRMPDEKTPLFCCFLDTPAGQIRQYFACTSKYFLQGCKRTTLQKLYKLENTCPGQARPHIVLHDWAVIVEYFTGRDSTSHSASQSLCYCKADNTEGVLALCCSSDGTCSCRRGRDFEQARA